MGRPFRVERSLSQPGRWVLYRQSPHRRVVGWFKTPGEAIDHAYKYWPWWP